jgi:signal transduction histidine kinase
VKILPRSLAGQMVLLIGIALLVAQLVNLGLLLTERQRASLAESDGPAITRFVAAVQDYTAAPAPQRPTVLTSHAIRGARYFVAPAPAILAAERRAEVEARLRAALDDADIPVRDVRVASRDELPPRLAHGPGGVPRRDLRMVRMAVQTQDGDWLVGAVPAPRRDPVFTGRIAVATGLLYLIVLGAAMLIALRLARPLHALTASAEAFGGRETPTEVTPRGPTDIRRLIEAFNGMNRRVVALLDEKDRMLGAIGHDLRTPLASMRIRAESLEPPGERARLIATLEETTAMLDDILLLARTGRARDAAREVDVAALVEALVEDYRGVGRPVSMAEAPRAVARVNDGLIRRAVRNLIDNALAYGERAELSVAEAAGEIVVTVADAGPGVPEGEIGRLTQPFERGEASRNRETGGAGLGLAIVKAIAEGHGGRLTLQNRQEGGLEARIVLPVAGPQALA